MFIEQLSVFLENSPGRLCAITKILADNDISIRAFGIADTESFGIMRMILDYPQKAHAALKSLGITAKLNKVIAVKLVDKPGAMNEMLTVLFENDIAIEYSYAYLTKSEESAIVVIKTNDDERTLKLLEQNGMELLLKTE